REGRRRGDRGAHQPSGLRARDRGRHAAASAGDGHHRRTPAHRGRRGGHGRDGARRAFQEGRDRAGPGAQGRHGEQPRRRSVRGTGGRAGGAQQRYGLPLEAGGRRGGAQILALAHRSQSPGGSPGLGRRRSQKLERTDRIPAPPRARARAASGGHARSGRTGAGPGRDDMKPGMRVGVWAAMVTAIGTTALAGAEKASAPVAEDLVQDVQVVVGVDTLFGTLVVPGSTKPVPLVLVFAGSGPTDRDGNTTLLKGKNDCYRMLADSLRERGIATLRYDKRGVGQSWRASKSESELKLGTYVDDAMVWARTYRHDPRF